MTKRVILTRGLPGSGKSFWAREQLEKYPGRYKVVNKDSLRAMLDAGKWSKHNEQFILKVRNTLILLALQEGYHVLVDDTNFVAKHETTIRELVKGQAEVEVKDFTDVPLEVCIERDRIRPNSVGEREIRKMYRKYLYKPPVPIPVDPELPWALLTDMDGTLALMGTRDPYNASTCEEDLPNDSVIAMVQRSYHAGDSIIIISGREEQYRPQTERWLARYLCLHYEMLLMRPTGDSRPDFIVKREIYEGHIQGKYTIRLVLDDRDQMIRLWRDDLGLPAFQVADGNF